MPIVPSSLRIRYRKEVTKDFLNKEIVKLKALDNCVDFFLGCDNTECRLVKEE